MEPMNILIAQIRDIGRGAIEILPQLFISLILLFITYLFAKLVRHIVKSILKSTNLRPSPDFS